MLAIHIVPENVTLPTRDQANFRPIFSQLSLPVLYCKPNPTSNKLEYPHFLRIVNFETGFPQTLLRLKSQQLAICDCGSTFAIKGI
jgi:hypothetical protein